MYLTQIVTSRVHRALERTRVNTRDTTLYSGCYTGDRFMSLSWGGTVIGSTCGRGGKKHDAFTSRCLYPFFYGWKEQRPSRQRNKVLPLFLPDEYVASLERRPTVWKRKKKKKKKWKTKTTVRRCSCPMSKTMPTSLQPRFDQVEGASGMRG